VKRGVVRVITPGLVVDTEQLDAKENNFLAAYHTLDGHGGLAFLDITTGEFYVAELTSSARLRDFSALKFREVLLAEEGKEDDLPSSWGNPIISRLPNEYFNPETARECLSRYFGADVFSSLALAERPWLAVPVQALLRYGEETQQERLAHINRLEEYAPHDFMILDRTCQATLELFNTFHEGRRQGSLIHLLDETVTAMGGRRLRWWLQFPLVDPRKIGERLVAVGELKERHLLRGDLRRLLDHVYDLERLGGRIGLDVATARDLVALKNRSFIFPL